MHLAGEFLIYAGGRDGDNEPQDVEWWYQGYRLGKDMESLDILLMAIEEIEAEAK